MSLLEDMKCASVRYNVKDRPWWPCVPQFCKDGGSLKANRRPDHFEFYVKETDKNCSKNMPNASTQEIIDHSSPSCTALLMLWTSILCYPCISSNHSILGLSHLSVPSVTPLSVCLFC